MNQVFEVLLFGSLVLLAGVGMWDSRRYLEGDFGLSQVELENSVVYFEPDDKGLDHYYQQLQSCKNAVLIVKRSWDPTSAVYLKNRLKSDLDELARLEIPVAVHLLDGSGDQHWSLILDCLQHESWGPAETVFWLRNREVVAARNPMDIKDFGSISNAVFSEQ